MALSERLLTVANAVSQVAPRAVGLALSARESAKYRGLRRVWRDEDGDWSYRSGALTVVSPFLTLEPPEAHVARAAFHWQGCLRPVPGEVVIDLGAGIGEDALLFADWVGPRGRVLAIEADPAIFRCLSKTVARSGAACVVPLNIAVGATAGVTRISSDPQFLARRINTEQGAEVRQQPLDWLLDAQRLEHIALLKMNIEGAEIDALAGGARLLERTQAVVISCHDFIANRFGEERMRTRSRVQTMLRDAGFVVEQRPSRGADWLDDIVLARRGGA